MVLLALAEELPQDPYAKLVEKAATEKPKSEKPKEPAKVEAKPEVKKPAAAVPVSAPAPVPVAKPNG